MAKPIQRILIVGGGTAGWMTASYLTKALGKNVEISLIESDVVKKIGVGEATLPSLQQAFFNFLGIPEQEWMKHVNGSYKVGVKFINWSQAPQPGQPDQSFYHIFGGMPTCGGLPLQQYWLRKYLAGETKESMQSACYAETALLDQKLSPVFEDRKPATFYAWHFDAHRVADYLTQWSTTRGVTRIIGDVIDVVLEAETGNIQSVVTQTGLELKADLFIDCSGFRSLLLGKALQEPFLDRGDALLCDSAVATPVPHDDARYGIEPYTSSIAMKHGWTWKTPMLGRFGSGYVYSSQFCSEDEATREFQQLWGLDDQQPLKHLKFRVGRTERAWVKNCVGIGLASSFLEPLESTGIYFIYAALYQLVKHWPSKALEPTLQKQFNGKVTWMFDDCLDFVQMHYFTTSREDTAFWRANRHDLKKSDSIQEKLELYRAGLPVGAVVSNSADYYSAFDFEFENFWSNSNYYCVLAGMGVYPEQSPPLLAHNPLAIQQAEQVFANIRLKSKTLALQLPSTYDALKSLHSPTAQSRELLTV
ncbi:MAG: tryptophan halogenase family protein [Thermosynechococcaceae cyanobacterium]